MRRCAGHLGSSGGWVRKVGVQVVGALHSRAPGKVSPKLDVKNLQTIGNHEQMKRNWWIIATQSI